MNQTTTFTFESIKLVCQGHTEDGGCSFHAFVNNPKSLSIGQIRLLNSWITPTYDPAAEELEVLNLLFDNQLSCPTHGRAHLGYETLEKLVTTTHFEISLTKNDTPD